MYFNEEENALLLTSVKKQSMEELFSSIPSQVQQKTCQELPAPRSENEIKKLFKCHEKANFQGTSFCGFGLYRHFIPQAVAHLSALRGFVTSYTPYQPEVAQGTLQALFEYQSLMAKLTDMDIANASLYEAGTAMIEALRMALRQKPPKQKIEVVFSQAIHPHFLQVAETYFSDDIKEDLQISFVFAPVHKESGQTDWEAVAYNNPQIFVYQNPNLYGVIEKEAATLPQRYPQSQILYGTSEALSLSLLPSPRAMGASIVWGEAQSLGIPVSMGGPSLGFLAADKQYIRQMPGRLIGETDAEDSEGAKTKAYVITLATREQHIRREKATSNICSNQSLMAVRANIFMSALGWQGMQDIALSSHSNLLYFKEKLQSLSQASLVFAEADNFHEVNWWHADADFYKRCLQDNLIPGVILEDGSFLTYFSDLDEKEDIDRLLAKIGE